MAQIGQSAVIKVNDGVTKKWKIDSASFSLFDVALHVCFNHYIKIYMHTIPEDVFILYVNIDYLQAIVS